ncbi:MAG: response regulator [Myxococcota bacterium]
MALAASPLTEEGRATTPTVVSGALASARLLVLDDHAEILRSMDRYFGLFVAEVHTAITPEEAERILIAREPGLLLCDYWLGEEVPPGTQLVSDWRQRFDFIRAAAMMTGTKATGLLDAHGVDAVFQKPLRLPEVKNWFAERLEAHAL